MLNIYLISILFYLLYKIVYNNFNQNMIQYDSFSPPKKTRRNIFQTTNKDDYEVNLRSSLDAQRKNEVNYGLIAM